MNSNSQGIIFVMISCQSCDPRVPLQRSKLENRENDIFGVKKSLFGGGSLLELFKCPKMSVPRFSNFDLCRGTLGSQCQMGTKFVSTALLLNEVSEKSREI